MHFITIAAVAFAATAHVIASPAPAELTWPVSAQDVVWGSPSADARGSMPLGNGDIGLNVWVEPTGDLVLLVAKTDSYDEFNRLLKIGRIRLRTTPGLVQPGQTFSQVLRLSDGSVEIQAGEVSIRVWVDANHPLAQVDLTSKSPVEVQVVTDNWRKENRMLSNEGPGANTAWGNRPDKMRVNADTVLTSKPGQLGWCHHNVESQWKANLELTALGAEVAKGSDPVLNRSFGALVRAAGATAVSDTELKTTTPVTKFTAQILTLTDFCDAPHAWQKVAEAKFDAATKLPAADRFAAHRAWWHAFWNRSWIQLDLNGKCLKEERTASPADEVTRAYALQRFVTACSGRGALPIKFNGSLFTVEGKDPDFRAWGGGYWFQNTREAYWSMLSAGDYEMMMPLFAMYRKALPLREAATQAYYKHPGAFFPETMYFWGNYMDVENYGIDRKGKPDGLTDNTYIRRYWQSGLELIVMMLDHYDGTQDVKFRDLTLLPLAKSIVTFYDQHWSRGPDGKILFDPAQSLETWHVAKNPTPEIVGLRYVINRLLKLPVDATTQATWQKTLRDLPAVPMTTAADGKRLLPAETFSHKSNMENPELYAVFPYRAFTCLAGGENLQIGRITWNHRIHKEDHGWQQNSIQAALLGLADEAKAGVSNRAARTAGYRFPGFFGPNYDWTPEQCHGTNMMTALQRMLMQCEDDQILLLPAWPKDWNASFKLHAPQQTTVQGRIENGRVIDLKVTPESRRKDIILPTPQ